MITVNSEKNYFHLSGKNYSYVMMVNRFGYLQSLHFGGRVGEESLAYLQETDFKSFSPTPPDILMEGISLDLTPREFAGFGQGDFRAPTAVIEGEDGAYFSRFKYCSFELADGAAEYDFPHARAGGGAQTLTIRLRDEISGIDVYLRYTVFDDTDVIVRNAEYVNGTERNVVLKKAFSFCVDLPSSEFDLLHFQGRHLMERMPERTPLPHGETRVSSVRGASSHQTNPLIILQEKDCTETHGRCYAFNLIYSGSFAMTAERSQTDSVRVQGGVSDFGFGWRLNAGGRFVAPQAIIAFSGGGTGCVSRAFADFMRAHLIPPEFVSRPRPIVVNNWEATLFDYDTERLLPLIDKAAELGADTFVLDDGWFGGRDNDDSSLGDWFVNEKKLAGGLNVLIDRCKSRGLRFGLWFEPEMVSENSRLFRAHPDWAIGKEGYARCLSRKQYVLDFTRDEIVDAVYRQMYAILSEHEISYVKWDMNRNITENYSAHLGADGQGEFAHRYILGVYRLARLLTEAFPHILFEGCAGGGGRFDAGALYYFPQIWTSDNTDGLDRAKIQYGTSFGYPLSAMSCHVSACPCCHTGRVTPLATRGRIASLGATGYELDLNALSVAEQEEIRAQISAYRGIWDLIAEGDLYRLCSPFESNYFCVMVVAKDKSRAYVVGEQTLASPDDVNRRLRLCGLEEGALYEIAENGLVLSGETLMNAGLQLPHLQDFGSWTWHLTKKSRFGV